VRTRAITFTALLCATAACAPQTSIKEDRPYQCLTATLAAATLTGQPALFTGPISYWSGVLDGIGRKEWRDGIVADVEAAVVAHRTATAVGPSGKDTPTVTLARSCADEAISKSSGLR